MSFLMAFILELILYQEMAVSSFAIIWMSFLNLCHRVCVLDALRSTFSRLFLSMSFWS